MSTELDPARLENGLGLTITIDGSQDLAETTRTLAALCRQVEQRREKSVVVLELGELPQGRREWPGPVGVGDVNRWERTVHQLEQLNAVTIAAARGTCGGPALDLLLAADFRIAGPDLRIMLPINDGQFWPGMSVFRLVRNVGLARAKQVVLWGTDLSLDKATELGLVDRVGEDLSDAVRTATVLLGRVSDKETALRRQLLMEAGAADYDDALGVHLAACDRELRRLRAATRGPDAVREDPRS